MHLELIYVSGLYDGSNVRPGQGSHYRIFPSLLHFMGYEREMTQALYGPNLFDPSAEPDTFNTRFNARLGQSARWYSIHADALRDPVAQDAGVYTAKDQRKLGPAPMPAAARDLAGDLAP